MVFVGTYAPRRCGIATFTTDLVTSIARAFPAAEVSVAAMNDAHTVCDYPPRVRLRIDEDDREAYRRAADRLNRSHADVVCVQHEFGIYGGAAGGHLFELLRPLRAPLVVTFHTVLRRPDRAYRRVMDELIDLSDRMVVMTERAVSFLGEVYHAPADRISVIPHGIPDVPDTSPDLHKPTCGVAGRPTLLTFGLLGPGKGIEHAISAMPEIVARHPDVAYLILGATHPALKRRHGEAYRQSLQHRVAQLGVEDNVIFIDRFVTQPELTRYLGAADIYLTPYPHVEQICSGTLAYALGTGKAIISTPYWHAEELLADGRGVLVPSADPGAIAAAANRLLGDPALRGRMQQRAYAYGRSMRWDVVARRYAEAFALAAARRGTPRAAV